MTNSKLENLNLCGAADCYGCIHSKSDISACIRLVANMPPHRLAEIRRKQLYPRGFTPEVLELLYVLYECNGEVDKAAEETGVDHRYIHYVMRNVERTTDLDLSYLPDLKLLLDAYYL